MIESRNLFRVQSKLTKNNRTIPIKSIEKDYMLSWVLIGIARSRMCDVLSFKGGTALKKFYFPDYRFSEDLDFTLLGDVSAESLDEMLREVYALILDASNIRLALKSREIHTNGYTFFINFSGPLGADMTRGEIKTDFTINEKLMNKPILKTLLREYDEYNDIPEGVKLKIYPLEEMFLEKYLSILDRNRSEPRDVYDLWYLVSNKYLEFEHLGGEIKAKGTHKGLDSFDIIEALDRKISNYQRLWMARLDKHVVELPHFDKVYRELRKCLRPLNQTLK